MPINNKKDGTSSTMDEIDVLIRSRYSILYLLTHEESRLENLLYDLSKRQNKPLYVWTATTGMRLYAPDGSHLNKKGENNDPAEMLSYIQTWEGKGLFLLKDFHPFLDDPLIVRRLRDLANDLRGTYRTVLIAAPRLNLPVELEKDITLVDIPLPSLKELGELFLSVCQSVRSNQKTTIQLTNKEGADIVRAAQGLTLTEAENAFSKAVVDDSRLDASDVQMVLMEKQQIIRKSGMLEFYPSESSLADVGGLQLLKRWLELRGKAFSSEAAEFGLPNPRGVLLLGAPGCGKSLTAKAISNAWGMPLLRLDFGKIFQSLVGSSEENVRRALKVAEGVAPAILWIDEIEKGLSGNSSGNSDAGTAARVFGTFLTWMQEKTAKVFVVATANRISMLPPELLRRGRFDEIFFTDLPNPGSRLEILQIHIKRRKRDPGKFNLPEIVAATEGYSGAEIEHCVVEGLFQAFAAKRELETADLLAAARETVPLSVTYSEELGNLRQWAKTRARPADSAVETPPAASGPRSGYLEVKP